MINNTESLPAEMQFYINCNRGYDVREDLFNEFKNNNDKDGELVTELLEDLYVEKISVDDLIMGLKQLSLPAEQISNFTIELLGRDLLVMDDYFSGKIYQAIKKLGGDPEKFQKYVNDFENDWRQESSKYIEEGELLPEDDGIIDPELEKKEISSQLSDDLRYVLASESIEANSSLQEANWLIGYVLSINESYKNDFIKSLLDNQTNLTDYLPTSDDQGVQPVSVASWLADYLSFSGSRFNDNLMAARYIIESSWAKKLSDKDRLRVKNLISLYRNIYNFPVNIDSSHPENTQFFPVDVLKIRYGKLEESASDVTVNKDNFKPVVKTEVTTPLQEKENTVEEVPTKEEKPIAKASARYQVVIGNIKEKNEIAKLRNFLSAKNLEEIIGEWRQGFMSNNSSLIVAAIMELFKRPNFASSWFNTPEVREVLSSQVVAYPSLAEPNNREGMVNAIVVVVVVKAILQRCGFNDEQSAVLFLQIASHEPKMASFVYFDAKTDKFCWRQFTDK